MIARQLATALPRHATARAALLSVRSLSSTVVRHDDASSNKGVANSEAQQYSRTTERGYGDRDIYPELESNSHSERSTKTPISAKNAGEKEIYPELEGKQESEKALHTTTTPPRNASKSKDEAAVDDDTYQHPDDLMLGFSRVGRKLSEMLGLVPAMAIRRFHSSASQSTVSSLPQQAQFSAGKTAVQQKLDIPPPTDYKVTSDKGVANVHFKDLSEYTKGHLDKMVKRDLTTTFIADSAAVMGDVTIGRLSSIFYNCVVRGDLNAIYIGERTNIQDGTVLHGSNAHPVRVGNNVTVGHNCTLHGCTIADNVTIGSNVVILDGAHVAKDSIIHSGTVVREGTKIDAKSVVSGNPAKVERNIEEQEISTVIEASAIAGERISRDHKICQEIKHLSASAGL
ncbi:hypothetical protein RI367_001537 [Sorochytrium milnesiophthora]